MADQRRPETGSGNKEELHLLPSQMGGILESITDGFVVINRDWRYVYVNGVATQLIRKTALELINNRVWDVFPGLEETSFGKLFMRLMEERVSGTVEDYFAPLDGWYSVQVYPTEEGIAVIFQDVTERKHAEEALRESEEKYRTLFASIGEGFCIVERVEGEVLDFRYIEANPAFAAHSGVGNVVGKTIREAFPGAPEEGYEIYERVVKTGEPIRFQIEVPTLSRVFEVYAFRIEDKTHRRIAVIFQDITERKRTEETLRESEARQAFLLQLGDVLRPLSDPIEIQGETARALGEHLRVDRAYYAEIDESTKSLVVHRDHVRGGASSMVGAYPTERIPILTEALCTGVPLVIDDTGTTTIISSAERKYLESIGVQAMSSIPIVKHGRGVATLSVAQVLPRMWTPGEVSLIAEAAERTWDAVERARAEAALRRAKDELEERVKERTRELATINTELEAEIAERKVAEEERGHMMRQLISAQEDERRRIARELHDEFGQLVSALTIKLSALKNRDAIPKEMHNEIEAVEDVAKSLDAGVEFIVKELRPTVLDDLGLVDALTAYINNWSEHFGIPVRLHSSELGRRNRLTNEIETVLYRIAQEALNNVVKHARAGDVAVILEYHIEQVSMIVEDDGVGFDMEQTLGQNAKGLGLIGIRERAALVGGSVTIESSPGKGTTIFVRLPTPTASGLRGQDE